MFRRYLFMKFITRHNVMQPIKINSADDTQYRPLKDIYPNNDYSDVVRNSLVKPLC